MNKLSGRIELWHLEGINEWKNIPRLGKIAVVREAILSHASGIFTKIDIRDWMQGRGIKGATMAAISGVMYASFQMSIKRSGGDRWIVTSLDNLNMAGTYNVMCPDSGTRTVLLCEMTAGNNDPFNAQEIIDVLGKYKSLRHVCFSNITSLIKKMDIFVCVENNDLTGTKYAEGMVMYKRIGKDVGITGINYKVEPGNGIITSNGKAANRTEKRKDGKFNKLSGMLEPKHFEGMEAWREVPTIGRAVLVRYAIIKRGELYFNAADIRYEIESLGIMVPSDGEISTILRGYFGKAIIKISKRSWHVIDMEEVKKVGSYDTSNPIAGLPLSLACEFTYGITTPFVANDVFRAITNHNRRHAIGLSNLSAVIRTCSIFARDYNSERNRKRAHGNPYIYIRPKTGKGIAIEEAIDQLEVTLTQEPEEHTQDIPPQPEVKSNLASYVPLWVNIDMISLKTEFIALAKEDKARVILALLPTLDETSLLCSIEKAYPTYVLNCNAGDIVFHPSAGNVEVLTATEDRLTFADNGHVYETDRNGHIVMGGLASNRRTLYKNKHEYDVYMNALLSQG